MEANIPAHVAEGRGRFGRDRRQLWRTAYGSARESSAHIDTAVANGYLGLPETLPAEQSLDRVRELLWSSVRP